MPGELTAILRDIVRKASESDVSNEDLATIRRRSQNCSGKIVVLADCSGSMTSLIGSKDTAKIEHLRIALADLLKAHPAAVVIAFGSWSKTVKDVRDIQADMGGTNLADALYTAAELRPSRTIIISDGLPDNPVTPLEAIDDMTGRVDCIYCGPDDHPAAKYLASLARRGGGREVTFDGYGNELSAAVRGLLGAPTA